MLRPGSRARTFESLRRVPLEGRAMDWVLGPSAVSPATAKARARSTSRAIPARRSTRAHSARRAAGHGAPRLAGQPDLGFAHLGGATRDNEEDHLIKKLFTAMGAVQIENQARI